MTRNFWSAPALALLSGLVLLVAGAAGWVTGEEVRDIGGLAIREAVDRPGTLFAPQAVAFGLGGLVGGVVLGVTRAGARRVAGAAVTAVGAGALVIVGAGITAAGRADGRLTPAPFLAAAAAGGLILAGLVALRGMRAAPPASSRYRVAEERPADDEWALAAPDEEPDA